MADENETLRRLAEALWEDPEAGAKMRKLIADYMSPRARIGSEVEDLERMWRLG